MKGLRDMSKCLMLENKHIETFLNRNGNYERNKEDSLRELRNEQFCNSEKLNSGLAAGVLIKKANFMSKRTRSFYE